MNGGAEINRPSWQGLDPLHACTSTHFFFPALLPFPPFSFNPPAHSREEEDGGGGVGQRGQKERIRRGR